MYTSDISKAITDYKNAIQKFKTLCIDFINSIEEIPIERVGSKNSNCFTVSFSTIAENNSILSPFYYDTKKQKEALITIVNSSNKNLFNYPDFISLDQYITRLVVQDNHRCQIVNINLEGLDTGWCLYDDQYVVLEEIE